MSLARAEVPSPASGTLAQDLRARLAGRVVVMGIGNPDRGDDGVGLLVAELLAEGLPGRTLPDDRALTVLMAGEVPESWLGPAAAARPDAVLMVDAVDMGAEPGCASLLEPEDLLGGATFTHRTPLALLSKFLRRETGADILLLAIQPRSVEWGEPMSPEVQEAARHLGDILASALHREAAAC
ncbi:MAG TPA: hydrogenase 3 maturation endopeptidase HyCI [Longimicrobiales bacterium]|nr:hydrogenase 3 maturation endopeptidase HyCI [Longimicrobiales bacterium]